MWEVHSCRAFESQMQNSGLPTHSLSQMLVMSRVSCKYTALTHDQSRDEPFILGIIRFSRHIWLPSPFQAGGSTHDRFILPPTTPSLPSSL